MDKYTEIARKIEAYCIETVDGYLERRRAALGIIDRERVPLERADWDLYNDITGAINDYSEENNICAEAFCPDDIIFS